MPNVDEGAKVWELDLADRVGKAVLARRKVLKMTAVALAQRTKALGYPISRVTVTKIENNTRAGKLDVAELLILARALELPPALLLFADFPQGVIEVVPGKKADNEAALGWLSGRSGWQVTADNEGTALVEDVALRKQLKSQLFHTTLRRGSLPADVLEPMIAELTAQLAATQTRIDAAKRGLWGEGSSDG